MKDLHKTNPILLIRYLIFIGTILVMFTNLFDCIRNNASALDFFLYVGVLFLALIGLMFVSSNWYIVVLFGVFGILTIIDIPEPNYISGGVIFFLFAKRIANNLILSVCIYFLTFIMVVGNHIYQGANPGEGTKVLIAYALIYFFDYLIFKDAKVRI